jgi:hypothetical protein
MSDDKAASRTDGRRPREPAADDEFGVRVYRR